MKKEIPFNACLKAFSLLFYFCGSFASADQFFFEDPKDQPYYKVQPSDTLTGVLLKLGLVPIYGPDQFLERTLKLNPELKNNPAEIIPTESLKIPLPISYLKRNIKILATNQVVEKVPSEKLAEESKPAPMRALASEQYSSQLSELTFGASTAFFGITGNDSSDKTTGELTSKLSGGVFFDWRQRWTTHFSTAIGLDAQEISILNTDDDKELQNRTNLVSNLDYSFLFSVYALSPLLQSQLGVKAAIKDTILYQGLGGGVYQVDVVSQLAYGLLVEQEVLKNGPMTLGISVESGSFNLRADAPYNKEQGSYYSLGLHTKFHKGRWGLSSELNYSNSLVKIESVSYNQESFNFKLGVIWSWAE